MIKHPYYPPTLHLPTYTPNTISMLNILIPFFVTVSIVGYITYTNSAKLRSSDKWKMVWFAICGCIHTFFEGYFVINNKSIVSDKSWFGQAWKEYAKADSRYLTSDGTVLYIEAITAFIEGPASFFCLYVIYNKLPVRHILTFSISFDLTAFHEDFKHSDPHWLYFYVYFVVINAPWIIVPLILCYDAMKNITLAVAHSEGKLGKKVE